MKVFTLLLLFVSIHQVGHSQKAWKDIISTRDIVLLGEQAHGVQTFYDKKIDLIQEIDSVSNKELMILVESPLVLSIIRSLQNQVPDYHYNHTNTIENIQFFNAYKNWGFDLQEDCRYTEFSMFLTAQGYVKPMDEDLLTMDSLLSLNILGEGYTKEVLSPSESNKLKYAILNLSNKVLAEIGNAYHHDLLQLCFLNRIYLAEYLSIPVHNRYKYRMKYRDQIMAENVSSLMKLESDKQVIVWAANLHVGKKGVYGAKWSKDGLRSMAEYLSEDYNLYCVAIGPRRMEDERFFDWVFTLQNLETVDVKYLENDCQ